MSGINELVKERKVASLSYLEMIFLCSSMRRHRMVKRKRCRDSFAKEPISIGMITGYCSYLLLYYRRHSH